MAKRSKAKAAKRTSKVKKSKKAKNNYARKSKKTTKRAADPCAQLRRVREGLLRDIDDIQKRLGEPDLPDSERRRLQALLRQKTTSLSINKTHLDRCEKLHPPPQR
jgi:hypothetical protein